MKKLILLLGCISFVSFAQQNAGFTVMDVEPGDSFSKMKLQAGDIIKKVNEKNVDGVNEVMELIQKPNNVKSLLVVREGKEVEVKL